MVTFHKKTYVGYDADGVLQLYCEGACLADDTKPTGAEIMNGSALFEIDTGKTYYYDAESADWVDPTATP